MGFKGPWTRHAATPPRRAAAPPRRRRRRHAARAQIAPSLATRSAVWFDQPPILAGTSATTPATLASVVKLV